MLSDPIHLVRRAYLERCAYMEGKVFLDQFYKGDIKLDPDAALSLLASRSRPVPHRVAVVFRSVRPAAPVAALGRFLAAQLP